MKIFKFYSVFLLSLQSSVVLKAKKAQQALIYDMGNVCCKSHGFKDQRATNVQATTPELSTIQNAIAAVILGKQIM